MKEYIIYFAICFSFYILGAYATTDITRLLKGSVTPVNHPNCYCPICKNKLLLRDQLPIISYIKNHGQCRFCNSKIPFSDLFPEIFLFLFCSAISILLNFSWYAFLTCFIGYECAKVFTIIKHKRRVSKFAENFIISLLNNILIFSFIAFLFALANSI